MNKWSAFATVVIGVSVSSAAVLGPCPTAPLSVYTTNYSTASGNSCQIDDKLFSNFGYTATARGGATAVPATSIMVNPLNFGVAGIGFLFADAWFANAGETQDCTAPDRLDTAVGVS